MSSFRHHFYSKALNTAANVSIILPTCLGNGLEPNELYRKNVKFQLLWLLHGGGGDDLDWMQYSSIAHYAEQNYLAVIMPGVTNSFYADSIYEMNYWSFLIDELPLLVNSYFPVSDKREDNFVAGLSMGAHGAMKMALNHPERFATMICLSGAGFSINTIDQMIHDKKPYEVQHVFGDVENIRHTVDDIYYQAKLKKEQNEAQPEMYIACGTEDFILPICRESNNILTDLGYKVNFIEEPGYAHQWDFWNLYMQKSIETWLPLRRQPIFE